VEEEENILSELEVWTLMKERKRKLYNNTREKEKEKR